MLPPTGSSVPLITTLLLGSLAAGVGEACAVDEEGRGVVVNMISTYSTSPQCRMSPYYGGPAHRPSVPLTFFLNYSPEDLPVFEINA